MGTVLGRGSCGRCSLEGRAGRGHLSHVPAELEAGSGWLGAVTSLGKRDSCRMVSGAGEPTEAPVIGRKSFFLFLRFKK